MARFLRLLALTSFGLIAANAATLRPIAADTRAPQATPAQSVPAAMVENLEKFLTHASRSNEVRIKLAQGKSRVAAGKDDELLSSPPSAAPAAPGGSDDLLLPKPTAPGKSDDSLLPGSDSGDKLLQTPPKDAGNVNKKKDDEEARRKAADAEHEKLYIESRYPSANTCQTCHPRQYEQWSGSSHAYGQLSPVFMAMQTKINLMTAGTNGDFCVRCHTQVGMNLVESVYVSNLRRPATSREGVNCVVCHRVSKNYGKLSGRFALEEGDIYTPIYGPTGSKELKRVLGKPEEYRVSKSKDEPGRSIHTDAKQAFFLTEPGFCGTCHDVTLLNGYRLEEAFAEYHNSPSSKKGVSCQDCHMGKVQGIVSGYDYGPAAIVGGVPTKDRKITDHSFAGPDYSIIHPGLFPHNVDAAKLKTPDEWLLFNYKAGWGTDKFENSAPKNYKFPAAWESRDDRYDGAAIIKTQIERLEKRTQLRLQVLRNGLFLTNIKVLRKDPSALEFSVDVKNITEGHGVSTGFDAERLIWVEVTVKDSRGNAVYKSGDRDPNGDVRDPHSLYVHAGKLPLDKDLLSLQSKFIVSTARGGEREQVLAVPTSLDVLPFVRPESRPMSTLGRPLAARKHKQNIEPGGFRTGTYSVPADKLKAGERYTITAKLNYQMVPINLIAEIQGAGFDYGMSAAEIAREVVRGTAVLWTRNATVVLQ